MDLSLIIFVVIVAVSAFRGYRSGIAVIVARILSLALAYASAILLTDRVAVLVQNLTPLKGLLSYFAAGTLIFIVAGLVFSSLFSLVTKSIAASSKETNQVSNGSAISGAFFGGIVGCFVGILSVWFLTTFQSLILIKKGESSAEMGKFQQTAQQLTGKAFEGIADRGLGDSDLASGAVKLLSNPGKNIQHYKQLAKSGELREFFQDNSVRASLDSRNPAALLNSKAFTRLANNPDFDALAGMLDLSEDPEQRNKLLATKVTTLWAQIQQVQNNSRYQEITNDPFIKRNLQSGNLFNLLNDQKIGELIKIISSTDVGEIEFQPQGSEQDDFPQSSGKVHRWVDENGKVHYSDKPTDNP